MLIGNRTASPYQLLSRLCSLTSCGDLELEIINDFLNLGLCELLRLLSNDRKVLSDLCAFSRSLLVAGFVVLKEFLEDLLGVLQL